MVWLIAFIGVPAVMFWWRLLVAAAKTATGQSILRRVCYFVGATWRLKNPFRAASLARQAEWKYKWLGGNRG